MTSFKTNWMGVLLGFCLAVLAAYHQFKLPPVLPVFIEIYGFKSTLSGAFMSIYSIAGLTLSMRLGSWLQASRLTVFLHFAFASLIVGSVMTLVWTEVGLILLVARGIEGVGFSILAIAGPSLCIGTARRSDLPLTSALSATWIPVGALLSALIAISVGYTGDWKLLWWTGILLTLLMWAWVYSLSGVGMDIRLRIGAVKPVESGKTRDERKSDDVVWQRRAQYLLAAVYALWVCQFFGFMTWLPLYLVSTHHLTLSNAVMGYTIPLVIVGVFNLLAAPLLRIGVPVTILLTLALLGQVNVWLFSTGAEGFFGLSLLVLFGVFSGLTPTCVFALPATILGIQQVNTQAFGILMTGRNLGVLLGPLLLGAALQTTDSWDLAAPIFGILTAGAVVGALLLHWILRKRLGK